MNAELLKTTENWLKTALQGDLTVDKFKAVTQLLAVLSRDAGGGHAPSFNPKKCREALETFFGKEAP